MSNNFSEATIVEFRAGHFTVESGDMGFYARLALVGDEDIIVLADGRTIALDGCRYIVEIDEEYEAALRKT